MTERISNKKFKVFELEELNEDLHKLDKWRIKLVRKHNPDTDKIEILSNKIRECKEKLNEFEEKVLQKGDLIS